MKQWRAALAIFQFLVPNFQFPISNFQFRFSSFQSQVVRQSTPFSECE